MGLPNPSRETKFSGANGDREQFIFHVQLVDHEQDWQPCPVVMVIHINIALHLYIHTAVVTHICIYRSESCTDVHVPKIKMYLVYQGSLVLSSQPRSGFCLSSV